MTSLYKLVNKSKTWEEFIERLKEEGMTKEVYISIGEAYHRNHCYHCDIKINIGEESIQLAKSNGGGGPFPELGKKLAEYKALDTSLKMVEDLLENGIKVTINGDKKEKAQEKLNVMNEGFEKYAKVSESLEKLLPNWVSKPKNLPQKVLD